MVEYGSGPADTGWKPVPLNAPASGTGFQPVFLYVLLRFALQSRQAFGRPDFIDLVEDLKRRHVPGKLQPRQLAAGEDMHVGLDRIGLVERARANEPRI